MSNECETAEKPRACVWCLKPEDEAPEVCAISGGEHNFAEVYVF